MKTLPGSAWCAWSQGWCARGPRIESRGNHPLLLPLFRGRKNVRVMITAKLGDIGLDTDFAGIYHSKDIRSHLLQHSVGIQQIKISHISYHSPCSYLNLAISSEQNIGIQWFEKYIFSRNFILYIKVHFTQKENVLIQEQYREMLLFKTYMVGNRTYKRSTFHQI